LIKATVLRRATSFVLDRYFVHPSLSKLARECIRISVAILIRLATMRG
jgi:hypothetical protein